jgi:hypothetical protein
MPGKDYGMHEQMASRAASRERFMRCKILLSINKRGANQWPEKRSGM